MNWLVYEDKQTKQLYPITIGRAAYAISCGGYRLYDRLGELSDAAYSLVRPHLKNLQQREFARFVEPPNSPGGPWMCVNARLAPSTETIEQLRKLAAKGEPFVARNDTSVLAALIPKALLGEDGRECTVATVDAALAQATASLPELDWTPPAFEFPHDIIRHHMRLLDGNLQHRLQTESYQEIRDGVFIKEGAKLGEHVVSDTRDGPILLDENASIGPYCLLSGPACLGQGARVIEHAAIKDGVSIGHTTKIGGEVEASVIEPFTNKQHYGFLGHSYLGSWINLGAGTCNSDLKNTYGLVNMEYNGAKVNTGMQFVGCVVGDYAKTAINTGIFTGKTIGAASMVYGFVTENVPSFVNYARLFGQVAELPPEVMIATQQRMFHRRNVEQEACDMQLIRDMFELTRFEREWTAGGALSL